MIKNEHQKLPIGKKSDLKHVFILGLILRISALIFILTLGEYFSIPYFISDDVSYELIAKSYLTIAKSPIDILTFKAIGASGYLTVFWPWVLCISAYIFRSMYAGRFINIILSSVTVISIYSLTFNISDNKKTAIRSAKLFAYLPVTVLTSCFPIKDIFLTFAVINVFTVFVKLQYGTKIHTREAVFCIVLLVAIYFTRGAVTEMLCIFFLVFMLLRFKKNRSYVKMLFCILFSGALLFLMRRTLLDAFDTKIQDYSYYALMNTTISAIQISSIWKIYKLPFSYFFATLQPMQLKLFSLSKSTSLWLSVISTLNITIYPVAIGNFMYIFSKKKDLLFWLLSFIMYSGVISLSLGIFRHYLFLLPIEMVNYSLYMENNGKKKHISVTVLSGILLLIVTVYSLV